MVNSRRMICGRSSRCCMPTAWNSLPGMGRKAPTCGWAFRESLRCTMHWAFSVQQFALGVPLDAAVRALETAKGVKGRVEVVPTPGTDYTILIDYAHAPDGLENVLSSVRGFCKGRLISVFGCGGDRDNTKRPIMGEIGARLSDIAIITSDNPRTEDPMKIIDMILAGISDQSNCLVEENRRKAIRMAMDMAQKDDIIVLCGKGHETYQILGTEKITSG